MPLSPDLARRLIADERACWPRDEFCTQLADALEAALAECERLGSYGAMMAEKRRRKDIGEQLDTVIADRDRLAAELETARDGLRYGVKTCAELVDERDRLQARLHEVERICNAELQAAREDRDLAWRQHNFVSEREKQIAANLAKADGELQAAKEENERMRRLVDDADNAARYTLGTLPSPGCRGAVETTNEDWVAVHKGRAVSAYRQLQRVIDAIAAIRRESGNE